MQVQQYRSRVSGPLLDRIDIQVEVCAVPDRDLAAESPGESSTALRARVASPSSTLTGSWPASTKTRLSRHEVREWFAATT
jgi:magnesium chelatase family protein